MNVPQEYEIVQQEYIDELESGMTLLRHKKSGARLLLMSNSDENKVFSIAFRTPVSDSTGVPHIIEHSVLCGSKKNPVKDPFMELAKSSLNTFLNAFTFPDKTMYPVASCNEKDLRNLMSVYMDAVLYPNIYTEKQIFMQEGWHYEMEDENSPLRINGVVYSEMKGAFSDPEETLERFCQNSLYPDTGYGFESGGDPEVIPSLTYEDFIAFHRRYYHPSNSYIYLYGNMDMEDQLRWLDSEYLKDFDASEPGSRIQFQEPFNEVACSSISYPIDEGEDTADRTWISMQWSIGDMLDPELNLAMQVLDYALLSSEGAPLKEALLSAGIGQDVFGGWTNEVFQPYYKVTAKNVDSGRKDEFRRIVTETLADIVSRGVDRTSLEAALNMLEFKVREADYGGFPKGLVWAMASLDSWLYDDMQPVTHLRTAEIFNRLRGHIGDGYYEDLIRKYLLDNRHASIVTAVPEPGLSGRREKQLSDRLQAQKAAMSKDEVENIVKESAMLRRYQDEGSSPEQLASLPHLELSDLNRSCRLFSTVCRDRGGFELLHHETATNGITYVSLLYDISSFGRDELHSAALLRDTIALLDTRRHTYGELSNEINLRLGGLDFALNIRERYDSSDFTPYMEISFKFLHGKAVEAVSLISEILFETLYEDENRFSTIIGQLISRNEMRIQGMSHSIAAGRSLSYGSQSAAYREHTTGLEYIRYVDSLKNVDLESSGLLGRLALTAEKIFGSCPLTVSVTDDAEGFDAFASALCGGFRNTQAVRSERCFAPEPEKKNEGLRTTSQVNYVALSGPLCSASEYSGASQVLRAVLANEYLWNALRVKGGAYGILCSFSRRGDATFVSYRDPNLERTYDIYRTVPDYVEKFTAGKRKLDDLKISVIGAMDTPLSPQLWGAGALTEYISGLTREMRQKERDEVIGCSEEDIRALAPAIRGVIEKWQICTVGGSAAIERAAELFDKVENLL